MEDVNTRGLKTVLRKLLFDESGQAIVEYILTLSIAVGIVTIIAKGFRKALFDLWEEMTKQIAAACPGCPADPHWRIR
jgi:Flp pilus assembly pilin Flp